MRRYAQSVTPKVMVAEDDLELLGVLLRGLKEEGFATAGAGTGADPWAGVDLPALGTTMASEPLARAAWPMTGAFQHLYMLALGELIALCEAAEKQRGIRPIRLVA